MEGGVRVDGQEWVCPRSVLRVQVIPDSCLGNTLFVKYKGTSNDVILHDEGTVIAIERAGFIIEGHDVRA